LLYWMTGAAFQFGLSEDLAPRVPVAVVSVCFLTFFFVIIRREFSATAATYATAILATSAGWLGFSYVGVTDLPMTACFAVSMLLCLRGTSFSLSAAILLALAVLAKGLVPIALALPLIWHLRGRIWNPVALAAFFAISAPWYLLCYWRNGWPFIDVLFLQHHFGRFASDALQHRQPFWFYLPVLAAALFPWTPMAIPLFQKRFYSDPRRRFLLLWVVFGFLFLSLAANKLPGYILPLLPAIAALAGIALEEVSRPRWLLAASGLMLLAIGPLVQILPQALAAGLSRSSWPHFQWIWLIPALAAIPPLLGDTRRGTAAITAAATCGVLWLKLSALPALDREASARPIWRGMMARNATDCVPAVHRAIRYGLSYYAGKEIPECPDAAAVAAGSVISFE
jgi:4-amino-4-deoxy-L-arabinose transferase-like glycosyltransferase